MTTSYSQPDTIYLSVSLDWHDHVLDTFHPLTRKLVNRKQGKIGRFLDLMYEAELEDHNRMRNMTIEEINEHMNSIEGDSQDSGKIGVELGAYTWECYGWSPRKGCPLTFENRKFRLHVMPKICRKTPNLYLELGQIPLWSHNWRDLLREADSLIRSLGTSPEIKLSRLDVATHTQEIAEQDLHHDNFKTRLNHNMEWQTDKVKIKMRKLLEDIELENDPEIKSSLFAQAHTITREMGESDRAVYRNGFKTQTIAFGRRGTKNPYVRMYVKSSEIAYSPIKKKLFRDVWSQLGFNYKDKSVLNIEFEMIRPCLRNKVFTVWKEGEEISFCMETVQDLLNNFESLMLYLMGPKGCIQMVVPNPNDQTRSRWKTDPRWIDLVDGLCHVSGAKIQIKKSPYRRDERMDKTLLSYVANYWLTKCEETGFFVPTTEELISEIYNRMTDSCINEIRKIAKSSKYRRYFLEKIQRESSKRELHKGTA